MTDRSRAVLAAGAAAFAAVSLWACSSGAASSTTAQTAASKKARTYVNNTRNAIGLALDSKGRLLYAEKDTGRIVRVAHGKRTTLATLHVAGGGEAGLLGLAVNKSGEVWAYYTSPSPGCPNPTKASAGGGIKAHCVWRFKPSGSKLKADKLIFSAGHPSSAENHVGGALHLGPDGALYLGLGELGENDDPAKGPGRAQDLSLPFGKIVRLNPNATNEGASGNPATCGNADNSAKRQIEDRRIWACGLRNPFSFDWDTKGRLWVADVGDSCDELNLVRPGVNYGWQPPRTDCAGSGDGKPVLKLSGTPSGVAVPKSKDADSWRGDVFFGVFADESMKRYDPQSKKLRSVPAAKGRTGWALVAGDRYLYMSNGVRISRLPLPGA
ncbi:MAG: PQQ-dependent sugar dehydrogenase [Solirubrobacterales bacterium]